MYILRRVGYPPAFYLLTGEGCFNHVGKKQNKEEEN